MADLELDGPNSAISVDTLKPKTGTTLTLGESGDTVTLPSGATFDASNATVQGIAGAIDWQTTAKTSAFTAAAGEGYFVDTSSAAITATLPASPSAGDQVAFKDYAANFATNNLTIARNGSNIQGNAVNATITTDRASVILVYVDATKGWLFTVESNVGNLTASVPDAPTIGTATATSGTTATVTFTAPSDDGGAPITQYTATSSPDGITGTLNQAGSGTITVSGLTTDTAYTFTVTATNSVGTSAASAASNSVTPSNPAYIAATGGSVSTDGDFKVHTFNSSGTLTITDGGNPDGNDVFTSLIVAGGGAGGFQIGGGGGGGGYREISSIPTGGNTGGITVTVGGGGAGNNNTAPSNGDGGDGSNSQISAPFITTYTSAGGGGGGGFAPSGNPGRSGGSGGGGGGRGYAGGSGNTPTVSPSQGNDGGSSGPGAHSQGGGGGGAGATGTSSGPSSSDKGTGGDGASSSITGSAVTRAGGGGGNGQNQPGASGGSGGGGDGGFGAASGPGTTAQAGTANTGGGGGGSRDFGPSSGAGGSGTVIIRYKFQN